VMKTQSAGPISCLEHSTTRLLHCTVVTRAAVLMFPLSLQSIISNQMRLRRLRGAWFSRFLRHPARRRSGSILSPGTQTGYCCRPYSDVSKSPKSLAKAASNLWNGGGGSELLSNTVLPWFPNNLHPHQEVDLFSLFGHDSAK